MRCFVASRVFMIIHNDDDKFAGEADIIDRRDMTLISTISSKTATMAIMRDPETWSIMPEVNFSV